LACQLFKIIPHNIHNADLHKKTPRNRGVVVIGGGLAGLVTSTLLAKKRVSVTLVEKKVYPFHRVCGEYISNEVRPFLIREDLFPRDFLPPEISELQLTSTNGRAAIVPLDIGGFGISRFTFDNFLYNKALEAGVTFLLGTEASDVHFDDNYFEVRAGATTLSADVVLGAFGKRSKLDHVLKRSFIADRSPYAAVKYHILCDHPSTRIALHNFRNGYCGISRVEDGKVNLCYLTHRDNLRQHKTISAMEEAVMFRNPFIKEIFRNAQFVLPKPEVINEISFATKTPVHDHVLMAGDAAGMITPLCGNGMAMAIHSAHFAAECITSFMNNNQSRASMEQRYSSEWNSFFTRRLWIGRQVQRLFGAEAASNLAVGIARNSPALTQRIVSATHGKEF
jgi:flavin-dependent dehydrogenase